MMKNLRNILFVLLLGFLFVEVLVIFPGTVDRQEEEGPTSTSTSTTTEKNVVQPGQKMKGIHLVESQQGHRDWELYSEAAEGYEGKVAWELKNIKVIFYSNDKVSFTVTGNMGSIDGTSKNLRVNGNVVTKSENGYIFKTPSIFYNSQKREILSPEEVSMLGPKDETGDGFNLDGRNMKVLVNDNRMFISENIRGGKRFKDGKDFKITSASAEFSGKSHQAQFLGGVVMNYNGMSLQGPSAVFQYKPGTSLMNYVQMQGGVKVSDANKTATAETLNLDLLKNMFTFRGKPKVMQDSDELTGEEIIFLDGGKKVKVEQVRARMEKKE